MWKNNFLTAEEKSHKPKFISIGGPELIQETMFY